jgi:hypothetical protein
MITRDYPAGGLRASDADRDRAVASLSEAFQDGRITADEFDHRSTQALGSRTGEELAALLEDLPAAPRAERSVAGWVVTGASAAGATALAALALANGLSGGGPDLAQRELARQILARAGLSIPLPPAPGFDWAGTITPAAIAALLIMAIIVVLRITRAGHRGVA